MKGGDAWFQIKFDTPPPAGEYLWLLSNPSDRVGVWSILDGLENYQSDVQYYNSGEICDTYHASRIEYTKTPNIKLVAS